VFRSSRHRRGGGQAGFSLTEVMVTTFIVVFGLVALAQLLAVTLQMHASAANSAQATRFAQDKVDELHRMNYLTAPQLQPTPTGVDSLGGNVTNYFDTPTPHVTRRWHVQPGPANTQTRVVTVRVLVSPATPSGRQRDLTSLVRSW
jgi:hypothetical protein